MSVIKRAGVENIASSLRLTVHHFARGTYPVRDRSALPVNRIFTVLENPDGKRNSVSDDSSFHPFRAGCIYVIPAHHCACMQLNENLKFISLQVRLEILPGIDVFSNCKRIFCFDAPKLARRIQRIYNMSPEFVSAIELSAFAYGIAAKCLKRMNREELETTTRFNSYRELVEYILLHCHAGITVDDLASVMHLGREAFTRKFTADTGVPPKRFFHRFLLKSACDLLLRPGGTVRKTAEALNFSNEYYFSRFFKKHTGISPADYRKYHTPLLNGGASPAAAKARRT
ncbi:MAG: HTH-type transcriptional activator Btr [Lentisphaerae bacterium ADurb.Bin242]|nr:MAG: HTH-type transcriptional activator Btr [Lentisphaerae bacterium ADurb.Bin242]